MGECIFCDIVAGEAKAEILYQDDGVTAFRDIHPAAPVHALLIPNRHIPSPSQVEPGDESLLGKLFVVARRLAEEAGVSQGYRLVVNSGPSGGQSVFHLHLHLLGGRRFTWPPG